MRALCWFRLFAAVLVAALVTLVGVTSAQAAPAPTPAKADKVSAPADTGIGCEDDPGVENPVICLPEGFGEDQHAPVGTGGSIFFGAAVVNHGDAVTQGATIVITLPDELRLSDGSDGDDPVVRYDTADEIDEDDGDALTCVTTQGGATITCPTGSIDAGSRILIGIGLTAQPGAQVGTSATFSVALDPILPSTYESSTVQASVDFVGTAHLTVSLSPTHAKVVVGKSTDLVATVVNHGPNAAPDTLGVGFSLSPDSDSDSAHFVITNAPQYSDGESAASPQRRSAAAAHGPLDVRVLHRSASPAADNQIKVGFWQLGTIASGATASVTIQVQARSLGSDELFFFAASAASDPICDEDDSGDEGDGSEGDGTEGDGTDGGGTDDEDDPPPGCSPAIASLTAVRAPRTSPGTSTSTAPTSAGSPQGNGAQLANSGPSNITPELIFGLLAILVGGSLSAAGAQGRARRTPRHLRG